MENKVLQLMGSRLFVVLAWVIMLSSCTSTPFRRPELNSRQTYVDVHRHLNSSIKEAIIKGRVIKGMNFDDVRVTWGEPNEIVTSENTELLKKEEVMWQYNRLFLVPIFVYFTNRIVTEVNDDYK